MRVRKTCSTRILILRPLTKKFKNENTQNKFITGNTKLEKMGFEKTST